MSSEKAATIKDAVAAIPSRNHLFSFFNSRINFFNPRITFRLSLHPKIPCVRLFSAFPTSPIGTPRHQEAHAIYHQANDPRSP